LNKGKLALTVGDVSNETNSAVFQLISASEDGSVALLDRRNGKVVKRMHFTKGSYPMCLKPFGGALYVGDKVGGQAGRSIIPNVS
jgi:hypothetical protein